jgi:hypothetical protein
VSDARTGKRFPLELPIKIHKSEEGGEHSGVTGNLSAAGVYIKADAALEMGSTGRIRDYFTARNDGGQRRCSHPMPGARGAHRRTCRRSHGGARCGLRD